MKFNRTLLIISFVIALVACSSPTLDTTTKETTEASLLEMTAKLPKDEAGIVFGTVMRLYTQSAFSAFAGKDPDEERKKVDAYLHGKTSDEILVLAENIKNSSKKN